MASSSSSSSNSRCSDGVFLSFRGEDTRKGFTDHLYQALDRVGIPTFRDDEKLQRAEEIEPQLVEAIKKSKIALIVLSKNYAGSRWCLEELAEIMECEMTMGQVVYPVFYDVEPRDVRKQIGSFGKAFDDVKERFKLETAKVERWTNALKKAADISGCVVRNVANGHEGQVIKDIITKVSSILTPAELLITKYAVGLDSPVENVVSMLNLKENTVCIIGICGMGGSGKTTIAKAVYNRIHKSFEGKCFLKCSSNVLFLQQQLIGDILMDQKEGEVIHHVDRGKMMIRGRLSNKKVLVILDDVQHKDQIKALAGEHDWFGGGSRIIITTRDKGLLKLVNVKKDVDKTTYSVQELNGEHSTELFCLHAFKEKHPPENYVDLTRRILWHLQGLPLAIEVWGGFLNGKNVSQWEEAAGKLEKIHHDEIQSKLKISYDALEDDDLKNIFLDIACFFTGMNVDYVSTILDGCGFYPKNGIHDLISKSLVKTDERNRLTMHKVLQDMGREIVRKESPNEPGERSRLWLEENDWTEESPNEPGEGSRLWLEEDDWTEESPNEPGERSRLWLEEDAVDVLRENKGTNKIQGFSLQLFFEEKEPLRVGTKAFGKMTNLRLFRLDGVILELEGSYENMPKKIRWLHWHRFPLESIPIDFDLSRLVVLEMTSSHLKNVWEDGMQPCLMHNLKILDLSDSNSLIRTPDFSKLPKLERLILEGCSSLVEVHESIGCLKKLVHLDMGHCARLVHLPNSIGYLTSLKQLMLSHCNKLEELPKELGEMKSLKCLDLGQTAIKRLPSSIRQLKSLETFWMHGCKQLEEFPEELGEIESLKLLALGQTAIKRLPSSIGQLKSLETLRMHDCEQLEEFPEELGEMESLKLLALSGTAIKRLPSSIGQLKSLEKLEMNHYKQLEELPEELGGMESLKFLALSGTAIKRLPSSIRQLKSLEKLEMNYCKQLEELPEELGEMKSLKCLDLSQTAIKRLPSSIGQLKSLEMLDMNHCRQLEELPEELGEMKSLKCLALSGTAIKRLPSSIGQLKSLENLEMNHCKQLEELPEELGEMKSLKCLDLMETAIKRLPSSIGQLKSFQFATRISSSSSNNTRNTCSR
ncbi:PREDICTED: protein SUPPRESSOR OF npr1-1, CONSTITUTIVE 1-like [Nelumbo nucifera]|uniref:Protein SUPPRESSOR OF npr1-1, CONSTITUTIVE 1-like n=2 Tax=Nelumbo nucifera TaxID=4432 RepID=A0A1U8ALW1_NELNU|nr:PREDICTED: protein SUPPRESSOR OF npr1-1, CONSTITUTIVE 1-like [Nelumbo nucifera]XP_019054024.1 PREDICTED: protein SUPPRESSOR OF npr1-1, CONSTITUTIVE 1-like [Nelumbo nucifera]DAD46219.1 TPA_asm: hypothetical protein HUJ06_004449 [Nelumbo nucifera]